VSWNHPDDVPTSLTRRAYALRGVKISQNDYAAVVADAYEDIARKVAHELAEKQRTYDGPSMTMGGNRMVSLELITDLIDPEVSS